MYRLPLETCAAGLDYLPTPFTGPCASRTKFQVLVDRKNSEGEKKKPASYDSFLRVRLRKVHAFCLIQSKYLLFNTYLIGQKILT